MSTNNYERLKKHLSIVKLLKFSPQKKSILIYGKTGAQHILKILSKSDTFEIFDFSIQNLYVSCLLYSIFLKFFKFKMSLRGCYLSAYIKHLKPVILISLKDNDPVLYELKLKQTSLLIIQNGLRINSDIEKFNINSSIDYGFFMTRERFLYLNGFFKNSYVIGSFKSGLQPISEKADMNVIGFVSSYKTWNGPGGSELSANRRDILKRIFLHTLTWCKINNKELKVMPRSLGEGKDFKDEFEFYKSLSKKTSFSMLPRLEKLDNYKVIDKCFVSIGIFSTLTFENALRGNRSIFICNREYALNGKIVQQGNFDDVFGKKFLRQGEFWDYRLDFKTVSRLLDSISNMSNDKWHDTLVKILPETKKPKKDPHVFVKNILEKEMKKCIGN